VHAHTGLRHGLGHGRQQAGTVGAHQRQTRAIAHDIERDLRCKLKMLQVARHVALGRLVRMARLRQCAQHALLEFFGTCLGSGLLGGGIEQQERVERHAGVRTQDAGLHHREVQAIEHRRQRSEQTIAIGNVNEQLGRAANGERMHLDQRDRPVGAQDRRGLPGDLLRTKP
jgi:hypothetical protein